MDAAEQLGLDRAAAAAIVRRAAAHKAEVGRRRAGGGGLPHHCGAIVPRALEQRLGGVRRRRRARSGGLALGGLLLGGGLLARLAHLVEALGPREGDADRAQPKALDALGHDVAALVGPVERHRVVDCELKVGAEGGHRDAWVGAVLAVVYLAAHRREVHRLLHDAVVLHRQRPLNRERLGEIAIAVLARQLREHLRGRAAAPRAIATGRGEATQRRGGWVSGAEQKKGR